MLSLRRWAPGALGNSLLCQARSATRIIPLVSTGNTCTELVMSWQQYSRWTFVRKPWRSSIALRVTLCVSSRVPFRLWCSRFATWPGGGVNKRTMPNSKTNGTFFTLRDLTVGDGSQFSKSFSDKQPDQRTVSPPILVGNGLRKTVLPGLLPGLHLLRVHSKEDREFPV